MRTIKFHVTVELPTGTMPHQSADVQAGIISEIIRHRSFYLYGGGPVSVHVTPDEQPAIGLFSAGKEAA